MDIRPFQAVGDTQNQAMDGTAKTFTVARHGSVNIVVDGTQKVFVRLDGTAATTSNGKPLLAGTDQTLGLPPGSTTVSVIGSAGSTVYVTSGTSI